MNNFTLTLALFSALIIPMVAVCERGYVSLRLIFIAIVFPYLFVVPILKDSVYQYDTTFALMVVSFTVSLVIGLSFKQRALELSYIEYKRNISYFDNLMGITLCFIGIGALVLLAATLGGVARVSELSASLGVEIASAGFSVRLLWELSALYFIGLAILAANGLSFKSQLLLLVIGVALYSIFTRRGVIINGLFLMLMTNIMVRNYRVKLVQALTLGVVVLFLMGALLWVRLSSYDSNSIFESDNLFNYVLMSPEFYINDVVYYSFLDYPGIYDYRGGLDLIPNWIVATVTNSYAFDIATLDAELSERYLPRFYAGTPPTIIGMSYINFGMLAPIFLVCTGAVMNYLMLKLSRASSRYGYILVGAFAAFAFTFFRGGDLWVAFVQTLRMPLLLVFTLILARQLLMVKK